MREVQGYEATVAEARQLLEAAQAALSRDVAQAVANAGWTAFLRDRYDVEALVAHISEAAQHRDFLTKLHAAADKARQQQPQRGRPRKPGKDGAQKWGAAQQSVGNGGVAI
jgi:hypothetical protein